MKRYISHKVVDESGNFQHTRIELHPLNPAFRPIVIEGADEGVLRILGEFVTALPEPTRH